MIEINDRHLCENCFNEISSPICPFCGFGPAITLSDPTMLRPGNILFGKYVIGKVIGKGGFGITYLAYNVKTNSKAAIKEFFPYGMALRAAGTTTVSVSTMNDAKAFKLGVEKFYNEAKLVSQFNGNPNIVSVLEFFYENDTAYFAMEYLEGHTLKEHIIKNGTLSAPQALFVMQSMVNALMIAHSANVLHRDISPDNIIICDNGNIKLIDFGAARQVIAEHSQSFSVILKPGFAPLEQYQKKGRQGPWTDIYSLGTTIFCSLTAKIPEDPMSRIDDDETLGSNKYNINEELWTVIAKATSLKVDDRYSDVFELKKALNSISFKPEPVIIPNEKAEQMPEFHTAVPFGMTQPNPQNQPVAFGGTDEKTVFLRDNAAEVQPRDESKSIKFPAKRKSAVFSAACVLVVAIACAIIIPGVLTHSDITKDGGSTSTNEESVSGVSSTSSTSSSTSLTRSSSSLESPAPSKDISFSARPSGSTYYYALTSQYMPLYRAIYEGIVSLKEEIKIPPGYENHEIDVIYYEVMYDNPVFYYVSDFELVDDYIKPNYYLDTNNSQPPYYDLFLDGLNSFAIGKDNDHVENLRAIHDKIIAKVNIVPRYSTATCTSSIGVLCDLTADDLGISKAFCLLAQNMGYKCVVVDGTVNGKTRSWCRVQIDGTWYNVDVYGDMLAADEVKSLSFDESGIFHTYFLTNDTFNNYCKYVPNSEYNFLLEGSYAANCEQANYYIEGGTSHYDFFYEDVDSAYNRILDWAAIQYNNGKYASAVRIASFMADEVWEKVKNNLIYDLHNKYNIDVSANCYYVPPYSEFVTELKDRS